MAIRLKLMRPVKIEFISRPRHQTVAYAESIENWLTQWTVPNNYKLVPVAPNAVRPALILWKNQLLSEVRSLFKCDMISPDYDPSPDFRITWQEEDVIEGMPFWPGCGSQYSVVLANIDEKYPPLQEVEEVLSRTK